MPVFMKLKAYKYLINNEQYIRKPGIHLQKKKCKAHRIVKKKHVLRRSNTY